MSGHNKWSTIKHKKGAADAKRGKIFTKIIKEITVAARMGGGDPNMNPRLRLAVSNARSENMPKDNIERAIKRGTGELEGVEYTEVLFEGYGPCGVAVLVEGVTDNINRTSAEIRSTFTKMGGNFGAQGSVAWMFDKKGFVHVAKDKASEDQLMEVALGAGALDIVDQGDHWQVLADPLQYADVQSAIEKAQIPMLSHDLSMIPKNTIALGLEDARKVLKLIEKLEENDDVQKVHGNYDIADAILEQVANEE